ncbi:hypothetical protein PybrP1_007290 [[Pythium] brassicae (nom. inval.)]|nr:hypothetical protein PybrP1_007290 [[Pythium] brassicae (nom. inval.)]
MAEQRGMSSVELQARTDDTTADNDADDMAAHGGDTLEELGDSSSGAGCDDDEDEDDDGGSGSKDSESRELPFNLYGGEEDVSKMDIEEVRLRLAELENASGPTKEEIDAILAQYSDYSSASSRSGSGGGGGAASGGSSDDGFEDANSGHQETVIMKVLVVGNARCGKTSTIRQFVSRQFSESYVSTIGADFVEKVIEYDAQLKISLQLWDIAGQDRFAKLTRAYFRDAKGALIVCDITRENTVDAVTTWKREIDACARDLNGGEPVPVVMVANKSDLLDDVVGALNIGVRMQKCVASNGILEWFRASAKSGDSVDDAFQCLVDKMVANHRAQRRTSSAAAGAAGEDGGFDLLRPRRDDDIIRLTSLPPLSYDSTGGFGCECN